MNPVGEAFWGPPGLLFAGRLRRWGVLTACAALRTDERRGEGPPRVVGPLYFLVELVGLRECMRECFGNGDMFEHGDISFYLK